MLGAWERPPTPAAGGAPARSSFLWARSGGGWELGSWTGVGQTGGRGSSRRKGGALVCTPPPERTALSPFSFPDAWPPWGPFDPAFPPLDSAPGPNGRSGSLRTWEEGRAPSWPLPPRRAQVAPEHREAWLGAEDTRLDHRLGCGRGEDSAPHLVDLLGRRREGIGRRGPAAHKVPVTGRLAASSPGRSGGPWLTCRVCWPCGVQSGEAKAAPAWGASSHRAGGWGSWGPGRLECVISKQNKASQCFGVSDRVSLSPPRGGNLSPVWPPNWGRTFSCDPTI